MNERTIVTLEFFSGLSLKPAVVVVSNLQTDYGNWTMAVLHLCYMSVFVITSTELLAIGRG